MGKNSKLIEIKNGIKAWACDDIIAYDWMMSQWDKYYPDEITQKSDFVELLNILQANGSNLDEFNDVYNENGLATFCEIWGRFDGGALDILESLREFHIFIKSDDDLMRYLADAFCDMMRLYHKDGDNWIYEHEKIDYNSTDWVEFCDDYTRPDNVLYKTRDGYVLKLYY